MTPDAKRKRNRSLVLIFLVCIILGSGITINKPLGGVADISLEVYQVAHPLSVYQGEQFNMSVSITNTRFEDVLDVNLEGQIPSEVEFLSSTIPDMVPENDTSEDDKIFRYNFGTIIRQEYERFTIKYNVTSNKTATITIPRFNVSYRLLNGYESFILAEPTDPIKILLKGEPGVTQEPDLRPPPSGTIAADPIFPVIGYLLPILTFGMSVFVMRRLLKRKKGYAV